MQNDELMFLSNYTMMYTAIMVTMIIYLVELERFQVYNSVWGD